MGVQASMRMEEVTVSRTKKVTDGNWGNNEILVAFKASVDSDETGKDVANALADLAREVLAEKGPKDAEHRARDKAAPTKPKEAPPTATPPAAPPVTTVTSESEGAHADPVFAIVSGAALQKEDKEGRDILKKMGFKYDPEANRYTHTIPRSNVRSVTAFANTHGLNYEFQATKTEDEPASVPKKGQGTLA